MELKGNRAIEDAAIAWVMDLERRAGRTPQDRRYDAGFPGDISSPPRIIEVKAAGGDQRGWFVPVEVAQYDEALRNPDFHLYVVDNVRQGDPASFRLKVFAGDRLTTLLAKAKERRYYEVPVPVAVFDAAPGLDGVWSSGKDPTLDLRDVPMLYAMASPHFHWFWPEPIARRYVDLEWRLRRHAEKGDPLILADHDGWPSDAVILASFAIYYWHWGQDGRPNLATSASAILERLAGVRHISASDAYRLLAMGFPEDASVFSVARACMGPVETLPFGQTAPPLGTASVELADLRWRLRAELSKVHGTG